MKASTRILIIGEDAPGALANSYGDAFRSLGWEVDRYCPRRAYLTIPGTRSPISRRLLRPWTLRELNRKLVRDLGSKSADLVLVVKGEDFAPETVDALRRGVGAPVVNFYPDDPFAHSRSNRLKYGEATLAAYDACFIFARHLVERYRQAGVREVHHLPFARDPELHRPPATRGEPEFDVVFAGNLDRDRLRWLEQLADFSVAIVGEHTRAAVPRSSRLRGAHFLPAGYGPELASALSRGRIAINVMRRQNVFSHNMRSFESLACGAFTLSQRTPELTELFQEGAEIVCAGTPEELPEVVTEWLSRPEEREVITLAGFRRVEHDTYAVRAAQIARTTGLFPAWTE